MLRERRRVLNQSVKPNRRLDRKSSRGMVFENEELRLRTINISADVERGQSDIRKLRRENELLRREIWTLRDEYDRLDKLLQDHHQRQLSRENSDENHTHHHHHHHHHADSQNEYSDNSTCDDETESSSDSCGKCTIIENYRHSRLPNGDEHGENSPKSDDSSGKVDGIHTLSTVSEETAGHSDITDFDPSPVISENIQWTDSKLSAEHSMTLTSFKMGGNLEELLTDIANLSHDIRKLQLRGNNLAPTGSNEYINFKPDILTTSVSMGSLAEKEEENSKKPFRSEVNLILSPLNVQECNDTGTIVDSCNINPPQQPLPPIGFESFVEEKNPSIKDDSTTKSDIEHQIPPPPPATKSTDFIRKHFLKSPSISLNEKPAKHQQHSNDKRLSLDLNPSTIEKNSTNDTSVNGKTNKTPTTPTTPTTPKSPKKSRNLALFFKRNTKPSKKNNDDDDDFYFNSPANQLNQSGGLRTTVKQQKQLFKLKTKNPKLRKQQMQQQQYRRNIIENRKSENSNNSKKYARLSIDENFCEENGMSGDETKSDKNSLNGGCGDGDGSENNNRSSNESTSSSFRSRKLSITSYHNNSKSGGGGEKIPWCACWGNGCF